MSLSKKNDEVGLYIADHSNICPVSNLITFFRTKYTEDKYVKNNKIIFFCIYLGTSYRIEWALFFTSKETWHWDRRLVSIDTRWCEWLTCTHAAHELFRILQCSCTSGASNGTETVAWIFIPRFFSSRHGTGIITGKYSFNKI